MEKKNEKIQKAIVKARIDLANKDYLASLCVDNLKKVFDISTDSLYPQSTDAGAFIKVRVNFIEVAVREAVERFKSPSKRKEIWLRYFKKEIENDPGRFYIYQFRGDKLIAQPGELPLDEVMKKKLSS